MGVDRAVIVIILTFIGLLIILALIFYYYRIAIKRTGSLNTTSLVQEILSIIPTISIYYKNKKSNTFSFLVFLILAVLVIITVVILYYLIYRGAISIDVERATEETINKIN